MPKPASRARPADGAAPPNAALRGTLQPLDAARSASRARCPAKRGESHLVTPSGISSRKRDGRL